MKLTPKLTRLLAAMRKAHDAAHVARMAYQDAVDARRRRMRRAARG